MKPLESSKCIQKIETFLLQTRIEKLWSKKYERLGRLQTLGRSMVRFLGLLPTVLFTALFANKKKIRNFYLDVSISLSLKRHFVQGFANTKFVGN